MEEEAKAASRLPQERDVVRGTPARDLAWAVACHPLGVTLVEVAPASVPDRPGVLQDQPQVQLATPVRGALFRQEHLEKERGRPRLRLRHLPRQPSRRCLRRWR